FYNRELYADEYVVTTQSPELPPQGAEIVAAEFEQLSEEDRKKKEEDRKITAAEAVKKFENTLKEAMEAANHGISAIINPVVDPDSRDGESAHAPDNKNGKPAGVD